MQKHISRRSLLVLPLAAALPHRARAAMPAITDAAGRSVSLKAPPERIVIAFNYEEFTAVAGPGGWDRVVGFGRKQWAVNRRAVWEKYRDAIPALSGLADVGVADDKSFSVERVLGLRPDLLIIHEWGFRTMAPLMAQIEQAGVPILVVDYNAQDPAKHVAGTLALGAAMGTTDRAHALADLYQAELADIRRRVGGAPAPKAYVELGSGGAGAIGNTYNDAMWGRMLELAGGANVAAGNIPTGWAKMSPEAVLAAAPAFVYIIGSSWANAPAAVRAGFGVDEATARQSLAPYQDRPGWRQLPAIRNGDLHTIEAGLARCLCDWVGTQYIAKQLHPAAFSDVDPVASLRRYHETFLPVPLSGTWMTRLRPAGA